jgi:hypothetical protein
MALGIRSVREMAMRSGVSRGAASAAEHGDGAKGTYERLENWLSEQEGGPSTPPPDFDIETIEFVVEGDFGVKVTVKGPIRDRAELEASVTNIIRSIRTGRSEDRQAD